MGILCTLSTLKAYRLKLYPTRAQAQRFARHAGACRWLWNHLLAMQKDRYAVDGTFVFPQLPVVVASGQNASDINGLPPRAVGLSKPYAADDLRKALSAAMG